MGIHLDIVSYQDCEHHDLWVETNIQVWLLHQWNSVFEKCKFIKSWDGCFTKFSFLRQKNINHKKTIEIVSLP